MKYTIIKREINGTIWRRHQEEEPFPSYPEYMSLLRALKHANSLNELGVGFQYAVMEIQ
jgi:hypothetical protein